MTADLWDGGTLLQTRSIPAAFAEAAEPAQRASACGRLTVKTGRHGGCVYFTRGRVGWVQSTDRRYRITHAFRDLAGVSEATLKAVYFECRKTGRNLIDILLETGVGISEVKRSILSYCAYHLRALLCDSELTEARFEKAKRLNGFRASISFELDEIFEATRCCHQSSVLAPCASGCGSQKGLDTELNPSAFGRRRTADPSNPTTRRLVKIMSNIEETLDAAMKLEGAVAAALVDHSSGLTLGTAGGGERFNIELAASGNTDVVRSKMRVMESLGISGSIEDMLITLHDQYHLIRPLRHHPSLFLYVALSRDRGNLGLARHRLQSIEAKLEI